MMVRELTIAAAVALAGLLLRGPASAEDGGPLTAITPDRRYVTVAQGPEEAQSIGSYAVRLYANRAPGDPTADFVAGIVRARDGFLWRLDWQDVTADGRQIVRDRDVAAARLTIGRAAENDIHLPDLAIDPHHAAIERKGDLLDVTALGTLGFGVDGVSSAATTIDPARGAELRFGSYNLTVSRDADGTPLVTIAQAASQDPGEATDEKARFCRAGKWAIDPSRSWLQRLRVHPYWHWIEGRPLLAKRYAGGAYFWHFRGINTGWKVDRSAARHGPGLERDPALAETLAPLRRLRHETGATA